MRLVCVQLQEQDFEKKYLTKVMEISNNYYATISFRGMCTVRNISTTFQYFDIFLYVGDKIKPLQNKKNLGYPRKKQSFYKEKDCFFLGYPKFFWPFLYWFGFKLILTLVLKTEKRWEKSAVEKRCVIWLNLVKLAKRHCSLCRI